MRHFLIIACTAALAGLTACSAAENRAPEGKPAESAPTDPSLRVAHPKNLAAVHNTCALLTPPQLERLGQDAVGQPANTEHGTQACNWTGERFTVTVTPNTGGRRDAAQMYRDAERHGQPKRFRIEGYPAAKFGGKGGMGTVEVAVSDTETITVDYTAHPGDHPRGDDPRTHATTFAAEVLRNIPHA